MRVAQCGVGHEQSLLLGNPFCELLRTEFEEFLAAAWGDHRIGIMPGPGSRGWDLLGFPTLGVRIPVHRDLAQVGQQFAGPVSARPERKEPGVGIDEFGMNFPGLKRFMENHVFQEGDVGLDPADPELPQGPVHPLNRAQERASAGGHLHQQRIVVGRDHAPGVAIACVQTDAETSGGAVVRHPSIVRGEVVLRILTGDAALDGIAVARDILLSRDIDLFAIQRETLGDENLGSDQIDSGDLFGHRMLHLDPRIHLDEEPLLGIHVVEELHRPRVVITHLPGDRHGGVTEFLDEDGIESNAGCDFDHLLVTPLHRAIPLMKVNHIAMMIA